MSLSRCALSTQLSVVQTGHSDRRVLSRYTYGRQCHGMRIIVAKASSNDEEGGPVPSDAPNTQQVKSEPPSSGGLAKGQGTAIVTGAISIIFGIAYLALVQVMDMRGGELQPPPPEAFMQ
jgi:hypothetical protein